MSTNKLKTKPKIGQLLKSTLPKSAKMRLVIAILSLCIAFGSWALTPVADDDHSSAQPRNHAKSSVDDKQQDRDIAKEQEPQLQSPSSIPSSIGPTLTSGKLYNVVSIVDGDTIKVSIDGKTETIRFIGMDTPETKDPRKPVQCFGKEASSRMQHYAQSKQVRLESDASQGDRDRYSRLLRYVYTEDGKNIAYHMIKEGYAHEYTYNLPYRYQAEFKQAYKQAQANKAGLWADNTCAGNTNQQKISDTPARQPTPPPVQAASPASTGEVYYKNCTEARAAGAAPVYLGQPGYAAHLDRDRDGIGCE